MIIVFCTLLEVNPNSALLFSTCSAKPEVNRVDVWGAERSLPTTPASCQDQTVRRSRGIRLRAFTKLMDQRAAAPTYETQLFQRLSGVKRAHTTCWQRSSKRRGISISQPVAGRQGRARRADP